MTWVKICGMTSAAAVAAAVGAGADAIGFVFAESRRRVSVERAVELAAAARGRSLCVAVMRHPLQHEVDEVMERFRPELLQTDAEDLGQLRLPARLQTLPVLRGPFVTQPLHGSPLPARVLFEGAVSGSGTLADWQAAGALARRTELVLAGGLDEHNVAAAIDTVRPYGVDVSSGVESSPGIKDAAAIVRFITAARTAAATARQEKT
jgi:phosphoribosylanthranilate isomerase